ncbi:zinc-ribbon domain-containing protein [Undibacterium sp. SXout7W]|uniref:zinc-ribbon domain-containing protein n=1 Tax=Undibacterium sp. SXout7W TaxID=3413049 RepID=UPI003BF1A178
MALINCSECNAEVSDKAAACPKCGNPISKIPVVTEKSTPWVLYTLGGIGILFVSFVIVGSIGNAAMNSPENLAKRKQRCTEAMMSGIGKSDMYKYSQEYRDNVKDACEGMEINGVKVVP